MHMREGVTISLEEEHNSYRRIDWRQLVERSEVMVGNGKRRSFRNCEAIDSLAREEQEALERGLRRLFDFRPSYLIRENRANAENRTFYRLVNTN